MEFKAYDKAVQQMNQLVDIETEWNLKTTTRGSVVVTPRRYRNRMEFKGVFR